MDPDRALRILDALGPRSHAWLELEGEILSLLDEPPESGVLPAPRHRRGLDHRAPVDHLGAPGRDSPGAGEAPVVVLTPRFVHDVVAEGIGLDEAAVHGLPVVANWTTRAPCPLRAGTKMTHARLRLLWTEMFGSFGNMPEGGKGSKPRARRSKKPSRHFLVDLGYEPGEVFAAHLFETGEFETRALRKLLPRKEKAGRKPEVARRLAELVVGDGGERISDELILDFCRQPRGWLALQRGKPRSTPTHRTAHEFILRREKGAEWSLYGPFGPDVEGDLWYLAARNVRTALVAGGGSEKVSLRWHVAVQVRRDVVAIHWNNFSHADSASEGIRSYPYYEDIPEVFRLMADELGCDLDGEEPNLSDVVLHGAFERCSLRSDVKWKHRRIRAYHNTVAVNASGGERRAASKSDDDEDSSARSAEAAATGLEILTRALAKTAARAAGVVGAEKVSKMERALLRQLMQEWGTRSYEFKLTAEPTYDAERPVPGLSPGRGVRMHVYFGLEGATKADALQHVHALRAHGGSAVALRFILEQEAMLSMEGEG